MKLTQIIFGISLLISSPIAFSSLGTGSSGGGYSVVCRNADGQINSAELLDLYEASHKFGLHLVESQNDIQKDYADSFQRIHKKNPNMDPFPYSQVDSAYNWFFSNTSFLDSVKPINDIGHTPQIISGCHLEQVAAFLDFESRVEIKNEIWEKLNLLNKAALMVHELMYRQFRELNDRTSEEVRANVACMFSEDCKSNFLNGYNDFQFSSIISNLSYSNVIRFSKKNTTFFLNINQLVGRPFFALSIASFEIGDIDIYPSQDGTKLISNTTTSIKRFSAHLQGPILVKDYAFILVLRPNQPILIEEYIDNHYIQTITADKYFH